MLYRHAERQLHAKINLYPQQIQTAMHKSMGTLPHPFNIKNHLNKTFLIEE